LADLFEKLLEKTLDFAAVGSQYPWSFYGTTQSGGVNGQGTIFKISLTGSLATLHSFVSVTKRPWGGLIQGLTEISRGKPPKVASKTMAIFCIYPQPFPFVKPLSSLGCDESNVQWPWKRLERPFFQPQRYDVPLLDPLRPSHLAEIVAAVRRDPRG
jgi:uncharacterized repeat protein (TIGR03803 family)